MRNFSFKLNIFLFVLFFGFYSNQIHSLVNNPLLKMDSTGNVIAAWTFIDESGNPIIQASTLPAGETTWTTPVSLSYSISTNIINDMPRIYTNGNGDVVVVWEYIDLDTFNFFLAAAIKPASSTSWNIASVTASDESANYEDFQLAINDSGNIVLLWTSTISNNPAIRMSSTTVGDTTTWSTPVTIAS